ncbi:MAG: TIGR00725 family protein [Candidatus Omnitrophota bacterium]|nr:TIGR00725 family protein [Candidatus Omnitrophota bacterium]
MSDKKFLVSVIGGHKCDETVSDLAERTGAVIAAEGAVLVCGGLGGIMEAACRGAKKAGGLTVGMIPGQRKEDANDFTDIVLATGMGYSRNMLVAGTADLVVALPGEYGTLTEIGAALNAGKSVYGLGAWEIPGIVELGSPEELSEIIREHMRMG